MFPTPKPPSQASCPECWKSPELCVCDIKPSIQTPFRFLILQHPREAKNPLGSARLLSLDCPNAVHRVGLSWRSLNQALGTPANPNEWAVLYLGTKKDSTPKTTGQPLELRGRKGQHLPKAKLSGIVLLDGNWKQSKTLWWRNPWLLKLNRVLLNPSESSHYGTLRKQPRARCLSTVEAGAVALAALGDETSAAKLMAHFDGFLEKVRRAKAPSESTPESLSEQPPATAH